MTLRFKFGKSTSIYQADKELLDLIMSTATLFINAPTPQTTLRELKGQLLAAVRATKVYLPESEFHMDVDEEGEMKKEEQQEAAPNNAFLYREVKGVASKWEQFKDLSESVTDVGLKNNQIIGVSFPDERGG